MQDLTNLGMKGAGTKTNWYVVGEAVGNFRTHEATQQINYGFINAMVNYAFGMKILTTLWT